MTINQISSTPSGYSCNGNPVELVISPEEKKKNKPSFSTKIKDDTTSYTHRRTVVGEGVFKKTCLGSLVTKDASNVEQSVDIVYQKIRKQSGLPLMTNDELQREVDIQRKFTHENIVKIHDCICYEPKGKIVVYAEKCDQDLKSALLNKSLDFQQKLHIMQNIASAIIVVHAAGYGHNDIKPENILLKNGNGKLSDFGLATKLNEVTAFKNYKILAPEQQVKKPKKPVVTEKTDVYQFGLTLWHVFHKNPATEHFKPQFKYPLSDMTGAEDDRIQKLINDCLKKDPQERPGMVEVEKQLAS